MARQGIQVGEPGSNARRTPAPAAAATSQRPAASAGQMARVAPAPQFAAPRSAALQAPAAGRAVRAAQQLNPAAAPAAVPQPAAPAEPAGTPIAPGARDLMDASDVVAKMFPASKPASESPLQFTNFNAVMTRPAGAALPGAEGGPALAFDPSGFDQSAAWSAEAIKQAPPLLSGSVDLGQSNFDRAAMNAGVFDPPAAANTAGAERPTLFSDQRSRAFLDASDSLAGTKAVRQVLAADIEKAGGDLQKYAADNNQMRPMAIKQLEGYLQGLQNGTIAGKGQAGGGLDVAFDPAALAQGQQQFTAEAFKNAPQLSQFAGTGTNVAYEHQSNAPGLDTSKAFQAPMNAANFDQFLGNQLREKVAANPANSNTAMLPYQTNRQVTPGVSGEPDSNALSVAASAGITAPLPEGMRETYAAQNANVLHRGGKTGNTVSLPQLTDEELQRMAGERTMFVTPPAGFGRLF